MSIPAPTLRPGDPPPFWDGPWHPRGESAGAVMVKPLTPGERYTFPEFGSSATATVPAAPAPAAATPEPIAQPVASATIPQAAPAPEPAPIAAGPAPSEPRPASPPPPEQQTPPAAPRSYVGSLLAQGAIASITSFPQPLDADGAAQFRAKAKELQAAGQLGPALQAIAEAVKRSPGDAAIYAQMGSLLLAGRAWEDAAHHFLLAYMLAPKEPSYQRMTLHAAWALGYVGWAFQIAQGLFKLQPSQDVADVGRQAQGWLASRAPAATSLCPACRTNALVTQPGPCPKCGQAAIQAPANAVGFAGIRLLQQGQNGRLFVGAACGSCQQETALLVTRGGPRCQHCQQMALPTL
ncbi:MAG TPA: hypothetical protein V6D47_11275 [Oscillatoriaceae cyanobacterium]